MNEELTNVPQGFKVAAARYNAIAVDQGRTPGQIIGDDSVETDSVRTVDNSITIENISLGVSNWRQFVDQLETEQRRRELQRNSTIRFNDGLFNGAS
jgi:phospholipase C